MEGVGKNGSTRRRCHNYFKHCLVLSCLALHCIVLCWIVLRPVHEASHSRYRSVSELFVVVVDAFAAVGNASLVFDAGDADADADADADTPR